MVSAKELAVRAAALEQAIRANSSDVADCLDRFDEELERVLAGIQLAFGNARIH